MVDDPALSHEPAKEPSICRAHHGHDGECDRIWEAEERERDRATDARRAVAERLANVAMGEVQLSRDQVAALGDPDLREVLDALDRAEESIKWALDSEALWAPRG